MARRRSGRKGTADPPDAKAALEIAAGFLGTRPRTRWEVERRLRRAGAAEEVITATVERLGDLGYLDDAVFVRWWGEQRDRHAPRGRRLLEAELRQRGVPRDVIDEFRGTYDATERVPGDAALPASDDERARAALERHLRGRPMPQDRKAVQRIGAFLMRRGFDSETVRGAIRAAAAFDPDEPVDEEQGGDR
jgi:regulatory protein